jgi:hypothetical protein
MIFRNLTIEGDWTFGAGRQNYAVSDRSISLNIETTIKTFLSECFFNPEIGVPWFDIIDSKNKDITILAIKSAIAACYGVIKVTELEYTYNELRELEIKYTISTIYESNLEGIVTI